MDLIEETEAASTLSHKLAAALSYAVASTLIMFVNKIALTGYGFPSFLAIAAVQYIASITVLLVQRRTGKVKPFPLLSPTAIRDVFPVSFIFLCNTVSGLGATKRLNMPMFVLLRRFSIIMTMGLEAYVLKKRFPKPVQLAVLLMVLGAVVAASADLSFDLQGVVMIVVNNFATALQGVALRKKMEQLSGTSLGTSGIMYYNNILSLPFILALLILRPGEIASLIAFPHWKRIDFLLVLLSSALMGFVLNVAYYWCTRANSPTTTTVIGAFKNILTSYAGMLFKDYTYSHVGFLGINISVAGSLWYNYEEYRKVRRLEAERMARDKDAHMEQATETISKGGLSDAKRGLPFSSVSHRHVPTAAGAETPPIMTPASAGLHRKIPAQSMQPTSTTTATQRGQVQFGSSISEPADKNSAREIISKRFVQDEGVVTPVPSFVGMTLPPPPVFPTPNRWGKSVDEMDGAAPPDMMNGSSSQAPPMPIMHKKTNSQTSYYLASPVQ